MTKDSVSTREADSEAGSARYAVNKLGAILCPAVCAMILVSVFAATYIATRIAWDHYDAYCARKFDITKLYVFPDGNFTLKIMQTQPAPKGYLIK